MILTKRKAAISADNVFGKIADENNVTIAEVREEIMKAISLAVENTGNKEDSIWSTMPKKGEVPTPEEVILWAVTKIREG